jgi:hypothetical protein
MRQYCTAASYPGLFNSFPPFFCTTSLPYRLMLYFMFHPQFRSLPIHTLQGMVNNIEASLGRFTFNILLKIQFLEKLLLSFPVNVT